MVQSPVSTKATATGPATAVNVGSISMPVKLAPGEYNIKIDRLIVAPNDGGLFLRCRCRPVTRIGPELELDLQAELYYYNDPVFNEKASHLVLKFGASEDLAEYLELTAVAELSTDGFEAFLAKRAEEKG